MNKQRKVDDEKGVFKDIWTELYFFIEHNEKPVCLVCNETVAVNKEYNLKRHHETKHKVISELKGTQRKEKLKKLISNLEKQQSIFKKQNVETENNTKASYVVSSLIAKRMKPFTDREFVKECLMKLKLCVQRRELYLKISVSLLIQLQEELEIWRQM